MMSTKKKFGQNLNKLFADTADGKGAAKINDGISELHMLGSSSKSKGNGLLQKKNATVSTPDAWGRSKQQQQQQTKQQQQPSPTLKPQQKQEAAVIEKKKQEPKQTNEVKVKSDGSVGPAWDEYGGRGSSNKGTGSLVDTKEYMAERAREKAATLQKQEAARQKEQKKAAAAKLKELEEKAAEPSNNDEKVIHLDSYEDRGERPTHKNRMLFDPKSGNMVAATVPKPKPARSSNNTAPTKDSTNSSNKKENKKQQTTRPGRGGGGGGGSNSNKKENEVGAGSGRDKNVKSRDNTTALGKNNGKTRRNNNANSNNPPGGGRGVLNNGKPRRSNSRNQRRRRRGGPNGGSSNSNIHAVKNNNNKKNVALFTGVEASGSTTGLTKFDLVKPGEKMDLLLNGEEPTLKPTAKAFAPSQAALEAAARQARLEQENENTNNNYDEDDYEDDDEEYYDDDDLDIDGLGFDPTQDMDGLILGTAGTGSTSDSMSPIGSKLHVDLNALKLDHSSSAEPRNIFAFDSAGTWGATTTTTSTTTTNNHINGESKDGWGGLFGDPAAAFLKQPQHNSNDGWGGFRLDLPKTGD